MTDTRRRPAEFLEEARAFRAARETRPPAPLNVAERDLLEAACRDAERILNDVHTPDTGPRIDVNPLSERQDALILPVAHATERHGGRVIRHTAAPGRSSSCSTTAVAVATCVTTALAASRKWSCNTGRSSSPRRSAQIAASSRPTSRERRDGDHRNGRRQAAFHRSAVGARDSSADPRFSPDLLERLTIRAAPTRPCERAHTPVSAISGLGNHEQRSTAERRSDFSRRPACSASERTSPGPPQFALSVRRTITMSAVTTPDRAGSRAADVNGNNVSRARRLTTETKAAFKTTEFFAFLAVLAGILVSAAVVDAGDFGAKQAWLYATILTVGYMVSRGLAKAGSREPYDADRS